MKTPVVSGVLANDSFVVRFAIVTACCVCIVGCCSEEDLPAFKKNLYSSDAKARNKAALGLARCGEKAADTVPRLGQLLYDSNFGVQSSAAYALRKIDSQEARAILRRVEEVRAARRVK